MSWKAALARKRGVKNLRRRKTRKARLARRANLALQASLEQNKESKEVQDGGI